MMMPGRKYTAESGYRYGFNGKENDNEVKGEGNPQDYGMRIYDPRLGRFLSEDPLASKFPYLTPYQFASNSPMQAIDLDGLESVNANTGKVENNLSQENIKNNAIKDKDFGPWKDLLDFKVSSSVIEQADKRVPFYSNVQRQSIENAASDELNLDYYSVNINKLPDNIKTPQELFKSIKAWFPELIKGNTVEFSALNSTEDKLWESDNPLGAIMHFDVALWDGPGGYTLGDDLSVITSNYQQSEQSFSWILTPVTTPFIDGEHPLAGNRQFGLVVNSSDVASKSYTFFIRAVDRPFSVRELSISGTIFSGAAQCWENTCKNLERTINIFGGDAKVGQTISKRISWSKDYLPNK